jgi:predicted DNA-binding protein
MASPLTLRLDEKTRERIGRIARGKGLSTSEFIRRAIEASVAQEELALMPYEAMKDLIGVVRGDPKLSRQMGRKFAKLLKDRRLERHSDQQPRGRRR